jgi:hypothetical protein
MDAEETTFEDGNISAVTRLGETVRRVPGFWTPAVHALLRYLEEHGFAGAPKVLGFDDHGREILGYIAGRTVPASLQGFRSDNVLIAVAHLLRSFHDVVAGFTPPSNVKWQTQRGAPQDGAIICHNDVAPWNTVFRGEHPVALLDWDYAAPGPPIWDVAHALWRYVPLSFAGDAPGLLAQQARRMVIFCRAYGLTEHHLLLDTIERRQQALYETVVEQAQAGVPGFVKLWNEGHASLVMNDLAYVRRNRAELEALLTKAYSSRL